MTDYTFVTTRPAAADSRAMMKVIVSILVAAALGCASDVDLPLDLERGGERPPTLPLGEPVWSRTELAHQGSVWELAWTADGGLLATIPMRTEGGVPENTNLLTRHEADGTVAWNVESQSDEFHGPLSATADGGAVVGVNPTVPDTGERSPEAGLDWYDSEGKLTASWRASAQDTPDRLFEVLAVQALSDDSVFWFGQTLSDDLSTWTPVAGLLDAERQLQWLVDIRPPEGNFLIPFPSDVALTGDGGIILLSAYAAEPSGGPKKSSFVVRLASDGSEVWRTVFLGCGLGHNIAVAPSGNLVVAGRFEESVIIGDRDLEDRSGKQGNFVAELDPSGQAVGLHRLQVPAAVDTQEIGATLRTMTMIGDRLAVGGGYSSLSVETPEQVTGYYAATNLLDGTLVSEIIFPDYTLSADYTHGPFASAATPEGRLALGGSFSGRVDFGDGEVDAGRVTANLPRAQPFILVLDPLPIDADID